MNFYCVLFSQGAFFKSLSCSASDLLLIPLSLPLYLQPHVYHAIEVRLHHCVPGSTIDTKNRLCRIPLTVYL